MTLTKMSAVKKKVYKGLVGQPMYKKTSHTTLQFYYSMALVISLDEIAPNAYVRCTKDNEKKCYMSIFDIIHVVCDKKNHYASNLWYRITHDKKKYFSELEITMHQFPGQRQKLTPVVTLEGAIELIMHLPGPTAATFRSTMAKIISRYLTGDLSLNEEIVKNQNMGESKSYSKFMHVVEQKTKRRLNEMMEEIPSTSYIYATYTAAFPGLVKIGRSRDVKARLSSGNTFTAPAPHVLIAMAPTFDAIRDEKKAHDYFNHSRDKGEFFKITHEEAKTYLYSVIKASHDQELEEYSNGSKGSIVLV